MDPNSEDKNLKYVELFRKSKAKVKAYETDYLTKYGKKPDLATAPENIRTCIKNCKKIQAYFKQKEVESASDSLIQDGDQLPVVDSGSEVKLNSEDHGAGELSTTKRSQSVWGTHLNKPVEISNPLRRHKTESSISQNSTPVLFSEASQSSQRTRLTLKRKLKSGARKNFFDTLGEGVEASTLPSPPKDDDKFLDPLSRFDPEISMSDSVGINENTEDLIFGDKIASQAEKCQQQKPAHSVKRQALSVLSVLSSQQKLESRLSFSGIFPKADTPVKSPFEETELSREPDVLFPKADTPVKSPFKETELSSEPDVPPHPEQDKSKKRIRNDGDIVENSPENVSSKTKRARLTTTNLEEGASAKEIEQKTNVYDLGFEEAEDDPKGFASAKPLKYFSTSKKSAANKNSENFVKINLKKKNYVRGKKTMTGAKYRRQEWKRKQQDKQKNRGKKTLVEDENSTSHDPDDALEDFDSIVAEFNNPFEVAEVSQNIPKESVFKFNDRIEPYFSADTSEVEKKRQLQQGLRKFGHVMFRPGQEEAMIRILSGESCLVVSATGSGKSLIYQLPAYLMKQKQPCITLVISPLVSLMEDQVSGLPPFLRAACLHYNQTDRLKEKVIEEIKSGSLHFLLVSPETVAGGGSLFGRVLQCLPPIAFVCIDEAHCVSQWSHNFRPAYLRLSKLVREKLGVNIVLGLTATAPESTLSDCATRLGVSPTSGIVRGPLLPDNLTLTVSKDRDRESALIELLQSAPFNSFDSIIVYCTRREECDRIACALRMSLQESGTSQTNKNGRTKTSVTAETYHAGLTAHKRKVIQNQFMTGKLRIVVATVAFGMGIDKSNIRGIIHFNMPKTFENYVQEIGRAGRDGRPARCHLFLDSDGSAVILNELRRYIHANSVDRHTVRKLIEAIFSKTRLKSLVTGDSGKIYREIALPINELVQQLDMPEENISTLLCYLENHEKEWLQILNPVYAVCTLKCYGGPEELRRLAATNKIVSEALKTQKYSDKLREVEFSVVDLSARMGWDSAVVKRELKNLQWQVGNNGRMQKSSVLVEFSDLAFHFKALTALTEDDLEEVLNYLFGKTLEREKSELASLYRAYRAFCTVATKRDVSSDEQTEKSNKLKEFVREYFCESRRDFDENKNGWMIPQLDSQAENAVRADVRQFVMTHTDHVWTGRAVARIFHGIQSPNFKAEQWGKVRRFWRAHLNVDFNQLCKISTQEVIKLRSKSS